jgi:hypothetical protein
MPCMCGDLYCRSCGPAQGNRYCGNCGEWADEFGEPGSEHDNDRCAEAVRKADEDEYEFQKACENDLYAHRQLYGSD